jgi:hypothetical protein
MISVLQLIPPPFRIIRVEAANDFPMNPGKLHFGGNEWRFYLEYLVSAGNTEQENIYATTYIPIHGRQRHGLLFMGMWSHS